MVSGGIVFTGTWTYTEAGKAGVTYQYSTTGIPASVSATLPSDSNQYYLGTKVYAKTPSSTSIDVTVDGVTVGTWTFGGWDKTNDTMVSGGIVFTGTWTYEAAAQYTITYIVDGNQVHQDTYYADQAVTAYSYTPEETYLTFSGWFSDADCSVSTTVPSVMPAENLIVYGKISYKLYDYTIKYFYQNEDGTTYTQDTTATRSNQALYSSTISTVDPIGGVKTGFVFDHTDPASGSITIGTGSNVLNVYYNRAKYGYTIEYYYNNTLDSTKTVNGTAAFGTSVSYRPQPKPGYVFSTSNPTSGSITIGTNADSNVIRVYYIKDQVAYTVRYYYDGILNSGKTENLSAEFEAVISTYPNKVIDGYKLDHDTAPLKITATASANVIDVYYVKDTFAYTVEYYYDGVKDASKTVNDTAAYQAVINSYTDKVIDGYKLDKVEGKPLTISSNAASNVIRVYYVKDTFAYTVEYYYDGVKDAEKTVNASAAFQAVIDSYTDKVIDGYKFDKVEGKPLNISSTPANNVISVYYVKDPFE
ncbi:MAG: InlB B-repeat-containing protein [Clostridiaceae bacterium]|nr:InlB B-repeat-containing protein [Clostridiaceae bacterium]